MSIDGNTIALVLIALLQAIAAFFTWRTRQDMATTRVAAVATQVAAEQTEKNTNSMVEKGLALQALASEAKGHAEGVAAEKADEASRAAGRVEERDRSA